MLYFGAQSNIIFALVKIAAKRRNFLPYRKSKRITLWGRPPILLLTTVRAQSQAILQTMDAATKSRNTIERFTNQTAIQYAATEFRGHPVAPQRTGSSGCRCHPPTI